VLLPIKSALRRFIRRLAHRKSARAFITHSKPKRIGKPVAQFTGNMAKQATKPVLTGK
jgi:hypothetical protein